jgi:hypothetical protein
MLGACSSVRKLADEVVVVSAYSLDADAQIVRCNTWEKGRRVPSLRARGAGGGREAAVVVLADGLTLIPRRSTA